MARWFDELSRKFARFSFFAFILDITRFSQKFVTGSASRFFFAEVACFYAEYSTIEEGSRWSKEGRRCSEKPAPFFCPVFSIFLSYHT